MEYWQYNFFNSGTEILRAATRWCYCRILGSKIEVKSVTVYTFVKSMDIIHERNLTLQISFLMNHNHFLGFNFCTIPFSADESIFMTLEKREDNHKCRENCHTPTKLAPRTEAEKTRLIQNNSTMKSRDPDVFNTHPRVNRPMRAQYTPNIAVIWPVISWR